MQGVSACQRGFALLEVSVALVVLALGMGMSMLLQGHSLQALQTAEWQFWAQQHVQSAAAVYTAQRDEATDWRKNLPLLLQPLQTEVTRQLPQGTLELQWTVTAATVQLHWQSDRQDQTVVVNQVLAP